MVQYCETLQARLAEDGLSAVDGDQSVQDHLAECEACFAVFEAIERLDPLLMSLSAHDAGDEIVDQTLNAIKEAGFDKRVLHKTMLNWREIPRLLLTRLIVIPRVILVGIFRSPKRYGLFAFLALGVGVASILFWDWEVRSTFDTVDRQLVKRLESSAAPTRSDSDRASSRDYYREHESAMPAEKLARGNALGVEGGRYSKNQLSKNSLAQPSPQDGGQKKGYDDQIAALHDIEVEKRENKELRAKMHAQMKDLKQERNRAFSGFSNLVDELAENDGILLSLGDDHRNAQLRRDKGYTVGTETSGVTGAPLQGMESFEFNDDAPNAPMEIYQPRRRVREQVLNERAGNVKRGNEKRDQIQREPLPASKLKSLTGEVLSLLKSKDVSSYRGAGRSAQIGTKESKKRLINNRAERFLAGRRVISNLRFKQATGYWANNYVPGDATVRRLHTTLLGKSLQPLEQYVGRKLNLHGWAHQTSQPFDMPENSALAVYLHSDQTGLQSNQRLLLQVGLQGSFRRSGSRPAMNVAVVLDLRGTMGQRINPQIRSLLFALNKSRGIGDRFSLVLAGKPGGLVIGSDEFRHGHLVIALKNIERTSPTNTGMSLKEAINTAIAKVRDTDDPGAPLGSSVVLLITNRTIGRNLDAIAKLAHQSAVVGVPLSTIAAGSGAVVDELDKIALAGQGNRRVLNNAGDAYKLINAELSSVSEVVARAVRLRIRLAAGVKLVDVVGSFSLDEVHARRVRQAEKSIDRRLSRNLGIQSDRGEDEEGIQIVIPTFHADTSHVVLLDVVASGPGAIADVTVRYKDLVQLKNGVARANLTLGRTERVAGPLERNVTKNLLAFHLSQNLSIASKRLKSGQPDKGGLLIREQLALLESFRDNIPGFDRDPDIFSDINMLKEYNLIMQGRAYGVQPEELIDSLAFAGKMKVLPRPDAK